MKPPAGAACLPGAPASSSTELPIQRYKVPFLGLSSLGVWCLHHPLQIALLLLFAPPDCAPRFPRPLCPLCLAVSSLPRPYLNATSPGETLGLASAGSRSHCSSREGGDIGVNGVGLGQESETHPSVSRPHTITSAWWGGCVSTPCRVPTLTLGPSSQRTHFRSGLGPPRAPRPGSGAHHALRAVFPWPEETTFSELQANFHMLARHPVVFMGNASSQL